MAPANTIQLQAIVRWLQGAMLLTMLLLVSPPLPPKKTTSSTLRIYKHICLMYTYIYIYKCMCIYIYIQYINILLCRYTSLSTNLFLYHWSTHLFKFQVSSLIKTLSGLKTHSFLGGSFLYPPTRAPGEWCSPCRAAPALGGSPGSDRSRASSEPGVAGKIMDSYGVVW